MSTQRSEGKMRSDSHPSFQAAKLALANEIVCQRKRPGAFALQEHEWALLDSVLRSTATAALAPKPLPSAGWRVVPVEPTEAMILAYVDEMTCDPDASSLWGRMLSAAPSPDLHTFPSLVHTIVRRAVSDAMGAAAGIQADKRQLVADLIISDICAAISRIALGGSKS